MNEQRAASEHSRDIATARMEAEQDAVATAEEAARATAEAQARKNAAEAAMNDAINRKKQANKDKKKAEAN